MPCTPERVWRAIVAAQAGELADPWREPPTFLAGVSPGQAADEKELEAAEGI